MLISGPQAGCSPQNSAPTEPPPVSGQQHPPVLALLPPKPPTHTSKAQVASAHHLTCVPPMVPLVAPASASRLPWVKREAESHSAPRFGHVSPRWGPPEERLLWAGQLGEPLTPVPAESREGRETGVSAPGAAMLRAPGRAVPAAQTLQRPGLGGNRLPSQAAGPRQPHPWSPRPRGSGSAPGRKHLNPSPKSPARGSGRAVERPGGRRPPLRAASRSRPPAPSSPGSPSCHTRPGSAGIRPTPAGAPRAGRAPGAERGGAAGPGGGPGRGGGGAAGSAEAWEGCAVPSFGGARDWRPCLLSSDPCLPGHRGPGGSNSAPRGRGLPRKPAERWAPLPPTFPSGVSYVWFFFFFSLN